VNDALVAVLTKVQLCSGLLIRDRRLLLVRCTYPEQAEPLWVLPGGRQEPAETIEETVIREFGEETSLRIRAAGLAYVSESIDPTIGYHVVNCTFFVEEIGGPQSPRPRDPAVVEVRFVPVDDAPGLLEADVLAIPVSAALRGDLGRRYFAFRPDDVKVPFFNRTIA
jgi:ADP-ribose pyrophosphatase YjhB (NUDIX family)